VCYVKLRLSYVSVTSTEYRNGSTRAKYNPHFLSTNCQPLKQSITEGHWCYDVEQLQNSAWEKKKIRRWTYSKT